MRVRLRSRSFAGARGKREIWSAGSKHHSAALRKGSRRQTVRRGHARQGINDVSERPRPQPPGNTVPAYSIRGHQVRRTTARQRPAKPGSRPAAVTCPNFHATAASPRGTTTVRTSKGVSGYIGDGTSRWPAAQHRHARLKHHHPGTPGLEAHPLRPHRGHRTGPLLHLTSPGQQARQRPGPTSSAPTSATPPEPMKERPTGLGVTCRLTIFNCGGYGSGSSGSAAVCQMSVQTTERSQP